MSERTTPAGERSNMRWMSVLAALLGLWIVASPFVWEATEAVLWNNVLVGAAVFLIGAFNYYLVANDRPTNLASMALAAILGLWVLITPAAFAIGSEPLVWSNVVAGLVVALLGGYVAYERRSIQTGPTAETR